MSFSLKTMIGSRAEFYVRGKGKIGKRFCLMKNSTFIVNKGSVLLVGERVSFGYGCIVKIHKKITIGNNVLIGPNVLIYDHDHDIKNGLTNFDYVINNFVSDDIVIGNNVWIGANVVILKGTKIGDNCVIGAGSIVKGDVPKNSVMYQKRLSTFIKIIDDKKQ